MIDIRFERINQDFIPKITVLRLSKIDEKIVPYNREGVKYADVRLTTYVDEADTKFYTFGLTCVNDIDKPGHGGEWSSNTVFINDFFNMTITPCTVEVFTNYPSSSFYAIDRSSITIPDNLEWREYYGSLSIVPKPEVTFPAGDCYFCLTILDRAGVLLYPLEQ